MTKPWPWNKCDFTFPHVILLFYVLLKTAHNCAVEIRVTSHSSWAAALFAVVVSSRMTSQKSRDMRYVTWFLWRHIAVLDQLRDGGIFAPGASGVFINLGKTAYQCFVAFIPHLLKFDFNQFLSYWLLQSKTECVATDVSAHTFALLVL